PKSFAFPACRSLMTNSSRIFSSSSITSGEPTLRSNSIQVPEPVQPNSTKPYPTWGHAPSTAEGLESDPETASLPISDGSAQATGQVQDRGGFGSRFQLVQANLNQFRGASERDASRDSGIT